MKRLSNATLAGLPPAVERPAYDRAATRIGVVHLGVGAFHRAHQAAYFDERLAAGEPDWAVCGASLRAPDTTDALTPQDGLYTLAVRSGEGERLRVIGALRRLLVAPQDPEALLAAMAHPDVRIVSLTVTEKGYCHDPATGTLREDHPDIRADLARPRAPRTAPGFLVEALRRRREAGLKAFTVLCCDNLPANGRTVARVVGAYASLVDRDLGRFVAGEVAFPSTMVDRIVPATTDADRAAIAASLGVADAWPVTTEPFTQWVIEDRFGAGRPRLEESGAELVADVAPYELMKLRLLNGSHSTLAYLGYLAGYETVSDVMADPAFRRLVQGLMDEEVTPTLSVPSGADLAGYKRSLLARFANPALRHRTWQIAMDGSQKLPQRLLGTIRSRLEAGAPFPRLALGVAAWMRYVTGIDERGRAIDVRDPLRDSLRALADAAGPDPDALARALLGVREVFGDLAGDPRLARPVTAALRRLMDAGARRTVAEWPDPTETEG
ncbi:MAG TPA: mannitol dehydrogenase family protein [Microvirga sp.]|nr:mannitol dehydrogenase family protein [Microvirga sp.]